MRMLGSDHGYGHFSRPSCHQSRGPDPSSLSHSKECHRKSGGSPQGGLLSLSSCLLSPISSSVAISPSLAFPDPSPLLLPPSLPASPNSARLSQSRAHPHLPASAAPFPQSHSSLFRARRPSRGPC